MSRICIGFASITVAVLLLAIVGDSIAAPPADSSASLTRIMQARADNFAGLKGRPLEDAYKGDHAWDGKERPFGLFCNINEGQATATGYRYNCGSAPLHGQEGNPLVLSDAAAEQLYAEMKAAFRSAAPDLTWRDGKGFLGENVLGARAPGEDVVEISLISMMSGAFVVSIYVYAGTIPDGPFK